MTVTATGCVVSSLACALLVLAGVSLAYGARVFAFVLLAVGAGWLGIIQASLLRAIAGPRMDRSGSTQDRPERETLEETSMK